MHSNPATLLYDVFCIYLYLACIYAYRVLLLLTVFYCCCCSLLLLFVIECRMAKLLLWFIESDSSVYFSS